MSFDLAVLAAAEPSDAAAVRAMFERCRSGRHVEGEPDARVVAFYERLRARFPDHPSAGAGTPWASTPLDVGIDHVIVSLGHAPRSDAALLAVEELAAACRLVVWDPQAEVAYPPPGEPGRPPG
ncbi:hypothetical protein RM844_25520 [Streptomyces sp. DSM 44915]|uniref:GNAT family N-acetyltransferase n=1 Tax=Streptomyces chisholmiae TaxID=3075540 RepID=A0ABU2JXS5_9ACTN|nr:hypothetical protein [Streptomyces sp. DSM 44915]MDT0269647.1 hypothetical protein [Streptomyces sp. DSM 44915]